MARDKKASFKFSTVADASGTIAQAPVSGSGNLQTVATFSGSKAYTVASDVFQTWNEIVAGYGKSLNKAFGSVFGAVFVIAFLFATSIAPLILGLLGNPYGWLGFAAIVATRVLSAIKSRGRVLDSVLHPISIAALIYLIVYSYLMRGTVQWKGRTV